MDRKQHGQQQPRPASTWHLGTLVSGVFCVTVNRSCPLLTTQETSRVFFAAGVQAAQPRSSQQASSPQASKAKVQQPGSMAPPFVYSCADVAENLAESPCLGCPDLPRWTLGDIAESWPSLLLEHGASPAAGVTAARTAQSFKAAASTAESTRLFWATSQMLLVHEQDRYIKLHSPPQQQLQQLAQHAATPSVSTAAPSITSRALTQHDRTHRMHTSDMCLGHGLYGLVTQKRTSTEN